MDRERLRVAWEGYYTRVPPGERIEEIEKRVGFLVGKMRKLACLPGPLFHEFPKRSLEHALGMSLGVHRQLLWRLTSSPWRGKIRREAGGNRF